MSLKMSKPFRNSSSKGSRDKSTLRTTSSLFANTLSGSEYSAKKPGEMDGTDFDNHSTNSLKTPKPSVVKSTSINLTSSGGVTKSRTKKPGSKIPRSKSRGRTDNEICKIERTPKADDIKDVYKPMKENDEEKTNELLIEDKESEEVKKTETNSLDSKSSDNIEIEPISSVSSYKDAEEEIIQEILIEERANEELLRLVLNGGEKIDEEREAEMQEKIIRNLYETAKHTKEPLFDSFKWMDRKIFARGKTDTRTGKTSTSKVQITEGNSMLEQKKSFLTVQEHYDHTIQEITQVWKNTVSVINCVKEHTIKHVEEKSGKIDKEQLTLEAEMLQLAVDFAISYSKLKMDFLLKGAKKKLEVREVEKSELETFLDSKTFAALYNEEDLAAMAQTVKELNTSILKSEDIDMV